MTKRAHILGVCGTFMGSLALLLKQSGWQISGSDTASYPPMSDLLAESGIEILQDHPDLAHANNGLMVIGNAMSRGNPTVEAVLNKQLPYISGPALLAQEILANKRVIAIAGTHGKTTTTSMLAWILEYAGHNPGFLIGGRPANFPVSARGTTSDVFVIEADEYDTAFFDKRSKFLHYRPTDLLINNIEFDHADIFPNLEAIQTQFHHLIRTVPSTGTVVWPSQHHSVEQVLAMGCWSHQTCIGDQWRVQSIHKHADNEGSQLAFYNNDIEVGTLHWSIYGDHNANNALASVILADNIGIPVSTSLKALTQFLGVARRQELLYSGRVTIYNDFAHHPTAIATTLHGFRKQEHTRRLVALVHLSSNTMRSGQHATRLPAALQQADKLLIYQTQGDVIDSSVTGMPSYEGTFRDEQSLLQHLHQLIQEGDLLVIMSNGNLGNICQELVALAQSIDAADA